MICFTSKYMPYDKRKVDCSRTMPSIEINHLYNHSRFPDNAIQLLYLLLYSPIGLCLVILRTILLLSVYLISYVLPDTETIETNLHKLLCAAFGIVINIENPDRREHVEAFISNQVSVLDCIVVRFAARCVMPGMKLNRVLSSVSGMYDLGPTGNLDTLKHNLTEMMRKKMSPLFFQPESAITNGKGLLKFNVWPFSLCGNVQPLTIRVHRPGFDIQVSTFGSSVWSDLFYFMFTPYTVYVLKFLPAAERKDSSDMEYAEKIRQDIGRSLDVELTNYSAAELKEYKKRYHAEQQGSRMVQGATIGANVHPEIHRMTMQVREVLPLVPYNVVYKNIAKTRSVDVTITKILEGQIQYTPEQPKPSSSTLNATSLSSESSGSSEGQPSGMNPPRPSLNTSATSFGKSSHERTQSFQERKQHLLQNARKRYIEKHGLIL